jgi:hypothetical protein
MPPTLVNAAVGLLLGVALLGAAFDRRSIVVVAAVAAAPDLDAALGAAGLGAANATLHSVFVPLFAATVLYYDTAVRERSWLGDRYGWYGVRLAWVAVAAYAVAGIGPDAFSPESAAFLYPISDRYYAVTGGFLLSTTEGIVQTYVGFGGGWPELASPGTVGTHHVDTWIDPAGEGRRLRIVESGWQAVLVVTAAVAVPAKALVERRDRASGGS